MPEHQGCWRVSCGPISQLSWESPKSRLLKIQRHGHQHWTCPDMSFLQRHWQFLMLVKKGSPDMKKRKKTTKTLVIIQTYSINLYNILIQLYMI